MARIARRQRWYRRAHSLAAYIANDGEIDPAPLLRAAYMAGKRVLLPRLRQKRLEFVAYRPSASLRRNRFNIPEPTGAAVALQKIDVVCVPLVGFDRSGRRLGMGGGFYDRTFSDVRAGSFVQRGARKNRLGRRRPLLLGLAYAGQQLAQVPHDAWDVQLAGIVTEREWIRAH